jgi:WD40 repeat protein
LAIWASLGIGQVLGTVFGNFGRNLVNFLGNFLVIDENLLVTGDEDGTVKLWDMRQSLNMTKVWIF